MADTKFSALAALTGANAAVGDRFVLIDISAGTAKTITTDELAVALGTLGIRGVTIDSSGLITGPAAGTSITGGTASGADLLLRSTAHATKGRIILEDNASSGIGLDAGNTSSQKLKVYAFDTDYWAGVKAGEYVAYPSNDASASGAIVSPLGYIGLYAPSVGGSVIFTRSVNAENAHDAGIYSPAAGVVAPSDGNPSSPNMKWFQHAGRVALDTDYTNATATMSNITGLSRTLTAGRKYTFTMRLFVSDSVAADGVKIDFDGGTATATDFRAHAVIYDTALLLSTQTAALATDISVATVTGPALIEVSGSFTVNSGGTFIPRAAQAAHTSGTLTIELGSHIWIEDTLFF